jgi:hypothetical protein
MLYVIELRTLGQAGRECQCATRRPVPHRPVDSTVNESAGPRRQMAPRQREGLVRQTVAAS